MINDNNEEIKVGQVWYDRIFGTTLVVISLPDEREVHFQDKVSVINREGGVGFFGLNGIKWRMCQLLAEYPTWQEAVNSKEFNINSMK